MFETRKLLLLLLKIMTIVQCRTTVVSAQYYLAMFTSTQRVCEVLKPVIPSSLLYTIRSQIRMASTVRNQKLADCRDAFLWHKERFKDWRRWLVNTLC